MKPPGLIEEMIMTNSVTSQLLYMINSSIQDLVATKNFQVLYLYHLQNICSELGVTSYFVAKSHTVMYYI